MRSLLPSGHFGWVPAASGSAGGEPAGAASGGGYLREGREDLVLGRPGRLRDSLLPPGGPFLGRADSRAGNQGQPGTPFFIRPGTVSWASVSSELGPVLVARLTLYTV